MSPKINFHGVIAVFIPPRVALLPGYVSLDEKWVKENILKLEVYFEESMLKEIIRGHLKPLYYL